MDKLKMLDLFFVIANLFFILYWIFEYAMYGYSSLAEILCLPVMGFNVCYFAKEFNSWR